MKKRKLIFAILLTFSVVVRAQDIHWSHTPESRAMINPAENGIDTLLKSTLIYRNQWRSLITAFQTTGINVNTPLLKGWGAGITYYNDRAGSAGWQQNNAIISTTYTQKIKEVSVTLGLGLGLDQKSVDMDKFILPSQIDPNLSITPYSGAALATKSTSFDNSIGLFASCPFDKSLLEVGLSAGHLLANDLNVLGNPDARYKQLYTFNTHVLYNLNANWEIDPYFTYQNQAKFQKIVAGSRINYTQNGNKIYGGLGYRMNDAVMGQIGFSQGGFRAGISYDYTLSSMKGNVGSSSAFELVIGYDIAFKKKKVSTPSTKVDTFIKK